MKNQTTKQQITKAEQVLHEVYAETYGITAHQLGEPGNALRIVEGLSGEKQLYFTTPLVKNLISVSPQIADKLGRDFLGSCSLEELAARFTGWKLEDRYPHLIVEDDTAPEFTHPPGYEIRTIDPSDHASIKAFLARNSAEDIEDALIDPEDPDEEIRMAYFEGQPVAYAGYRVWNKGLSDTGILVHPDHRGRGLGKSLVGEVTAACLANHRIPFWRTWDGNPGSYYVALANRYVLKWKTEVYEWEDGPSH
jgi:GNAT superfamily N-acetyltransferase